MIELKIESGIAVVALAHAKPQNPFTRAMTRELTQIAVELEADDTVEGALIWGGAGRSFSVGGDFEDLRRIATPADMEEYLRDIVRCYQALLRFSKPLVAAIEGHAIGQGLQVALLADWRVASDRARCQMPELENGVPCPLGSALLEAMVGRAAMLHLVVGCERFDAEAARGWRLFDEVVAPAALERTARERLARLRGYAAIAWRATKRLHNARLIALLESVREEAARMHARSFFSGAAEAHFRRVLGEGG